MKKTIVKIAILIAMWIGCLCYVKAQTFTSSVNSVYKWEKNTWKLESFTDDPVKIKVSGNRTIVYAKETWIYSMYNYLGETKDDDVIQGVWKAIDDGGVKCAMILKYTNNEKITFSFMYSNLMYQYDIFLYKLK